MQPRILCALHGDRVVPLEKTQFVDDAARDGDFLDGGRAAPGLFTRIGRVDRAGAGKNNRPARRRPSERSEEHTSELQSLMRISYAVFCLKKKINTDNFTTHSMLHN